MHLNEEDKKDASHDETLESEQVQGQGVMSKLRYRGLLAAQELQHSQLTHGPSKEASSSPCSAKAHCTHCCAVVGQVTSKMPSFF